MSKVDIRSALSSDDRQVVQQAIAAATEAAPTLEAKAAKLESDSLNPALSDADAAKARSSYDAARFQAERMAAALQALIERDAALEAAESEEARREQYDDAAATLQAAMDRHAASWDAHALALASITLEIERAKAAADKANADLPADALRLTLPKHLAELRAQAKRLRTTEELRVLSDWPGDSPGCVPVTQIERKSA